MGTVGSLPLIIGLFPNWYILYHFDVIAFQFAIVLAGKHVSAVLDWIPARCALFRLHLGIQRDGYRRFHHAMASLILVLVYILVLAINRELSAAAAFHVCFDA